MYIYMYRKVYVYALVGIYASLHLRMSKLPLSPLLLISFIQTNNNIKNSYIPSVLRSIPSRHLYIIPCLLSLDSCHAATVSI